MSQSRDDTATAQRNEGWLRTGLRLALVLLAIDFLVNFVLFFTIGLNQAGQLIVGVVWLILLMNVGSVLGQRVRERRVFASKD